uniref:Uncharacterized protein n=1 Tax=Anopheles coluzzii TaxID=1518534 RepID=A0A8W7PS30_ANOCL
MTIITLTQNHHLIIIAPARATGLVVYYLLRTHCYSHRFVLGRPPEGTVRHWMEHEMDKFPPSVMDSLSGMNESSCPGGSASLFPVRAIVLRVANGIRLLVQPDRGETRHPVDEQCGLPDQAGPPWWHTLSTPDTMGDARYE